MVTNLIVNKIKPSQLVYNPNFYELSKEKDINLEGGDNGLILVMKADNDSSIEILAGDSVFSGGSRVVPVYYEGLNYLYLESGRHVIHNSDGTNTIKLLCKDDGVYCDVIQLV